MLYVARSTPAPDAHPFQGVFTNLIDNLGVKDVQFEEIISLDSETLRQQRSVGMGQSKQISA